MAEKIPQARVAHFSHSTGGGAGIAARRIHEGLIEAGVRSVFFHGFAGSARPSIQPDNYRFFGRSYKCSSLSWFFDKIIRFPAWLKLQRALCGRPEGLEAFSPAWQGRSTPFDPVALGFDVVHLHMVTEFLDTRSFFAAIPADFPIVWTLHDMSAFTGGCHYCGDCRRFESRCGCCPQLGRPSQRDLSARSAAVKIAALAGKKNLHIVGDSRWIEGQARKSPIFAAAKTFRTIHYGLDTAVFRPLDKVACREELKLPPQAPVICFGAESIVNRRKGLGELLQALTKLNRPDLVALVFGGGVLPDEWAKACKIVHMDFVNSADMQAKIYSACDFFVIPSLQEAFGQTALESMSCGRAVVGFDVGGIPEFVLPMETGLLARCRDVDDLADRIGWMIDNRQQCDAMGQRARKLIEVKFSSPRQTDDYIALYEEVSGR